MGNDKTNGVGNGDEEKATWYFSVIDIVRVLTEQADYQAARKYWNKLKQRLSQEGSESVTKCHQLKMQAVDGKNRLTDVAAPRMRVRLKCSPILNTHKNTVCSTAKTLASFLAVLGLILRLPLIRSLILAGLRSSFLASSA